MATIIADTLFWNDKDSRGARVHDLLGTRCDLYINSLLSGLAYDFHYHSNLTQAIVPLGLFESDVHNVINLFQAAGLDAHGRYFLSPSPAEKGHDVEFIAEQDKLTSRRWLCESSYGPWSRLCQARVQAVICRPRT
jgi:uncharacterized protein YcgI (DUF1989 family)